MINIQYLSILLSKEIHSIEDNEVKWVNINTLKDMNDVDEGIKIKALSLYKDYRNKM